MDIMAWTDIRTAMRYTHLAEGRQLANRQKGNNLSPNLSPKPIRNKLKIMLNLFKPISLGVLER